MSDQRLEDALRRIEELERQVGNRGALSGFEAWRAFFAGRTKLDGRGLQVKADTVSGDGGHIAFLEDFNRDLEAEPPSRPVALISARVNPTFMSTKFATVEDAAAYFAAADPGAYDADPGVGTYGLLDMTAGGGGAVTLAAVDEDVATVPFGGTARVTNPHAAVFVVETATAAYVVLAAEECHVVGAFYTGAVLSPAQLTANTDNYAPTGIQSAAVLRLSTDASRNLTGIVPTNSAGNAFSGRRLTIINVGAQNLVLVNNATSTEANRFLMNANLTLNANEAVELMYDAVSSRWRCVGEHL